MDSRCPHSSGGEAEYGNRPVARPRRWSALRCRQEFISKRRPQGEPVFETLKPWLEKKAPHVPPQTALGYTLGQWEKLVRYLEHPLLTPDTNRVENKIRPFAIGRNWLFSGSPRGANATAGIYSLIETAKANGLDSYRYMRTLITQLPVASNSADFRSFLPYTISLD